MVGRSRSRRPPQQVVGWSCDSVRMDVMLFESKHPSSPSELRVDPSVGRRDCWIFLLANTSQAPTITHSDAKLRVINTDIASTMTSRLHTHTNSSTHTNKKNTQMQTQIHKNKLTWTNTHAVTNTHLNTHTPEFILQRSGFGLQDVLQLLLLLQIPQNLPPHSLQSLHLSLTIIQLPLQCLHAQRELHTNMLFAHKN